MEAYQLRQQATQEALLGLEEIIKAINQAEKERAEKAMLPEAFAVYWLLKREDLPDPEGMAREMEAVFKRYPHWRSSDH